MRKKTTGLHKMKTKQVGWLKLCLYTGGSVACVAVLYLLPEHIRGLFALLYLSALLLVPQRKKILQFLKGLKCGNAAREDTADADPAEKEAAPLSVDMNPTQLYLIQPNVLKPDAVFKALAKDGSLYFCKVGGQSHFIDDSAGYSPEMSRDELLGGKGSFFIKLSEITLAAMDPKNSLWFGGISNNGSVRLTVGEKEMKFIVHPVQPFEAAEGFLRRRCGLPVDVRERKADEEPHEKVEPDMPRAKVRKIRQGAAMVGYASILCALWLMFYPVPYDAAVVVNLLLPPVGIFLYVRYHSVVRITGKKNNNRSNVAATTILLPSMALGVRALMDVNMLYSAKYWVCLAVLAVVISLAVVLMTEEYRGKKWLLLLFPLLFFTFAFGAVTVTNYAFDDSKPVKYSAVVEDMRVDTGSRSPTTYHLVLGPWGDKAGQTDATVPKDQYDKVEKGSTINVYVFDGLWGFRWYMPYSKSD